MKVAELRQVLEKFAALYASGNRSAEAAALCKLSIALKPADRAQVTKTVEKLTQ
jgi:hypothetical protein